MDFNQNKKMFGLKNIIIIAFAVISLLFYCIAPYITVSVEAFGQSQSEGTSFLSEILFEDGFLLVSIVGILTILSTFFTIVTAIINNFLCSFVSAGLGVLSLVCAMIKAESLENEMSAAFGNGSSLFGGVSYNVSVGWGLWLSVICLILCAIAALILHEKETEVMPSPPQRRSVAVAIIFSILTCGIYSIYWFIKLTDETNYATEEYETSGGIAFLLTLITCGIYSLFWMYKQGEKLDRLAIKKGQYPSSRGVVYLLLSFFGFGIVSYALMQDSLNKLP